MPLFEKPFQLKCIIYYITLTLEQRMENIMIMTFPISSTFTVKQYCSVSIGLCVGLCSIGFQTSLFNIYVHAMMMTI